MNERIEQAILRFDVCAACGKEKWLEAVIGDTTFDSPCRGVGLPRAGLWAGHPNDGVTYCYPCLCEGRHLHPDHPLVVPGLARARMFANVECDECDGRGCAPWQVALENGCQDGRCYIDTLDFAGERPGLRLMPRPPDDYWSDACYGIKRSADGTHALLLSTRERHWCPAGGLSSSIASSILDGGAFVAVLDEDPWPSVQELTLADHLGPEEVRARYGEVVASRMRGSEAGAVEVALRVPTEILQ